MEKYPSHRFHPSLGVMGYVEVANQDQDEELQERDGLFRDTPYSQADCDEWVAKNPKAKKAQGPTAVPKVEQAVQAQTLSLRELATSVQALGNMVNDLLQRVKQLEDDDKLPARKKKAS